MSAVIEQINEMSMADKMQLLKYLVVAIEQGVAKADVSAPSQRCLTPDPMLYCTVDCNLFEDSSDEWESA